MRQLKIIKSVTNRDSQSLDKYLQEIGKEPLITAEKEVELARLIKQGDMLALEQLARANLRFVVSVAKQYQNKGLSLPDLISEGNVGLIKAAGRFDETRGFKFISYAVWWIRQQILQSLAEDARVIRIPLNQVGSLNKINKAFAKLEQEYERPPSAEELAIALDLPTEKVAGVLQLNEHPLRLDKPMREDFGSDTLGDMTENKSVPSPVASLMTTDLREEIERALSRLKDREADVVKLFYGIGADHGLTLEEIGAKFDLTRERARQIKEKAIRKMRHNSRSKLLKAYLG
jgi:RNA polymerase primary sigma factor